MTSEAHEGTATPGSNDRIGLGRDLTRFIGRHDELAAVAELFDSGVPLVTLLGPPGIGKTRLARRFLAIRQRTASEEKVLFCDLREARDAPELCSKLGQVLEMQCALQGDTGEWVQSLGRVLSSHGPLCLALDNFEQLAPSATETVHHWLRAAPNVQFLVTSRQALQIAGERLFELGPLPLPKADSDQDCESMTLFFDHAEAVEPRFDRRVQAATVADLVKRLEGIPLAIELAASQMHQVSPSELKQTLSGHLLTLRWAHQDADPRHATLRAAIDSTWQLLTPWAREAFAQLSVFCATFDHDAAETVIDVSHYPDAPPIAEIVASLRRASVLKVARQYDVRGCLRWDLYEALREYGAEQLRSAAREPTNAVQKRHAEYHLERGESWVASLRTNRGVEARDSLSRSFGDLRAAFQWFVQAPAADKAARMALVLSETLHLWMPAESFATLSTAIGAVAGSNRIPSRVRARLRIARADAARTLGKHAEAESDLAVATALAAKDPLLRGEATLAAGLLHWNRGDVRKAKDTLEHALGCAEAVAATHLDARTRLALGWVHGQGLHDTSAVTYFQRAAAHFRECGDRREEARALTDLHAINVFYKNGDLDALREHTAIAQHMNDRRSEYRLVQAQAIYHLDGDAFDLARRGFEEARKLARRNGMRAPEALAAIGLAMTVDGSGNDNRGALRLYEEALAIFQSLNDPGKQGMCLALMGGLEARRGHLEQGKTLIEKGAALMKQSASPGDQLVCEIQHAQLKIAVAQAAAAQGAVKKAAALRRDVRDWTTKLKTTSGSQIESYPAARFALRFVRAQLFNLHRSDATLTVWQDGSAFQIGEEATVPVPDGPVIRRILQTLAEARQRSPGQPLSTPDLVTHGWPGERIRPEAGARRVHTTITRLRRRGLGTLVVREKQGYLLDPSVPFQLTDASIAGS